VARGCRWSTSRRVRIIVNDTLAARYATALAHAGVTTEHGDRHAAAQPRRALGVLRREPVFYH
jgi:hypothetical protein